MAAVIFQRYFYVSKNIYDLKGERKQQICYKYQIKFSMNIHAENRWSKDAKLRERERLLTQSAISLH